MTDTNQGQCGSCRYFMPEPYPSGQLGNCRRFPPQRGWQIQEVKTSNIGEKQLMQVPDSEFPLVLITGWCGEYVPSGIGPLKGTG